MKTLKHDLRQMYFNPFLLIPEVSATMVYNAAINSNKKEVETSLAQFYRIEFSGNREFGNKIKKHGKTLLIFIEVRDEREAYLANLALIWLRGKYIRRDKKNDHAALYLLRGYGKKYYSEFLDRNYNPLAWENYRSALYRAISDFAEYAKKYKISKKLGKLLKEKPPAYIGIVPYTPKRFGKKQYYTGFVFNCI